MSCLDRLCEFGYVTDEPPSQPEPEKESSGRIKEVKKIIGKLKVKPVVNLYGSAGVGKTTLSKEICEKWNGEKHVFDLREAKDMTA